MATAAYDQIAEWYDGWIGDPGRDPLFAPVEALMGPVAGQRVLDLACGQGRVARHLAERGARVVGVDLSGQLLAIAAGHERAAPHGIGYLLDDAQRLASLRDASFDGVVCQMALMDIPELAPTLAAVARVLRPGGWFVFAVLHPCFNPPSSTEQTDADGRVWRLVNGYWDEGFWRSERRQGPPRLVGAYHRTLSTYVNGLTDAGFAVERMAEPPAAGRMAEARPVWTEVPPALAVRCRRCRRSDLVVRPDGLYAYEDEGGRRMVVAVYPKLGELLQRRGLTVAELQRQIEGRFALPVDRKTLYRLTYHEPVKRAELDVAAAAAAVLGIGLGEMFEVEANPVTEELGDLTPEEASRMAELLDAQARRTLNAAERAELEGLVDEYGRRLVERALRERAERRGIPLNEERRQAELAVARATAWLTELDGDAERRRKLNGSGKRGRRGRRLAVVGK